jgi:hypothetical protein
MLNGFRPIIRIQPAVYDPASIPEGASGRIRLTAVFRETDDIAVILSP